MAARIVFFTGAGMSAGSGVPTCRGGIGGRLPAGGGNTAASAP